MPSHTYISTFILIHIVSLTSFNVQLNVFRLTTTKGVGMQSKCEKNKRKTKRTQGNVRQKHCTKSPFCTLYCALSSGTLISFMQYLKSIENQLERDSSYFGVVFKAYFHKHYQQQLLLP